MMTCNAQIHQQKLRWLLVTTVVLCNSNWDDHNVRLRHHISGIRVWVWGNPAAGKETAIVTVARASLSSMCSVTHFFRNCFFFLRQAAVNALRRAASTKTKPPNGR